MTLEGEILPHDDPDHPLKVVFRNGSSVLAEWPVIDEASGRRRIQSAMRAIGLQALEPAQEGPVSVASKGPLAS
jgi:hypothetical protein